LGAFIRVNVPWKECQDLRDQIPIHLFDLAADLGIISIESIGIAAIVAITSRRSVLFKEVLNI
jgi:hypothetical protein